jgi:hypothetical protein
VIRGVGALPRIGVPPSRNCFHSLRRANDKVHSRAGPFAVQPPYHKARTSELVLFDGNSIAKVCKVTYAHSGRIAWRSKADAASRQRTTAGGATDIQAPRAIDVSFLGDDVLVTQMGELCSERVFVGEATQVEDDGVVLYASDHGNG